MSSWPTSSRAWVIRRLTGFCLAALVVVAACGDDDDGRTATEEPAVSTATSTTTSTPAPTTATTTTVVPHVDWPPLPDGPATVVVTPTGVVAPVIEERGDQLWLVRTPCSDEAEVTGTPLSGAHVVIDPGHGSDREPGAVGPSGLQERDVNLAISQEAARILQEAGATVVLTRTFDHEMTIRSRAEVALALRPQAFVSIHHNADPDGPSDVPGAETYFQIADPASKRLSGLLWEELFQAFSPYRVAWVADTDHGAKYRPGATGGDYYGILRRSAGVPTVLSEAAFISNPPEEALLADPAFQEVEATAVARAVARFVGTDDPGSGFVEPYPREEPAGGGGGPEGCVDPPLG